MKSGMQTRVLLVMTGLSCWVGCAPVEPAEAPRPRASSDERKLERDQRALDERRLQLQNQVLADLRKLKERRQASASGEQPASDDGECELLVFGGETHEVFLGCLSQEQRPDSVFNLAGEHGSELSPTSMRNKFAPYGSNYEDTSACNPKAKRPPVVVSSGGKSLGLLTTNPDLKRRIAASSVADWLARMCGY